MAPGYPPRALLVLRLVSYADVLLLKAVIDDDETSTPLSPPEPAALPKVEEDVLDEVQVVVVAEETTSVFRINSSDNVSSATWPLLFADGATLFEDNWRKMPYTAFLIDGIPLAHLQRPSSNAVVVQ